MKAFGLLFCLVSASAVGSTASMSISDAKPTFVERTYVCHKYTDNELDIGRGMYTKEGAVTLLDTEIRQRKDGFTIAKNNLFPNGSALDNPVGGSISGQAGNHDSMIFKRQDDDRKTYFIVYMTNPDPKSDGEINRAIFIADCSKQ